MRRVSRVAADKKRQRMGDDDDDYYDRVQVQANGSNNYDYDRNQLAMKDGQSSSCEEATCAAATASIPVLGR